MAAFLQTLLDEAELRPCDYCQELDGVKLRRKIAANGVEMFLWYCILCQRHARKEQKWISHSVITWWQKTGRLGDLTAVPILEDYSQDCLCAVCGQPGAEFHHYAPQAFRELFGEEWSRWPTGYLCRYHHRQWHSIVTWFMPGPASPNPEMLDRYERYERIRP